jgi:dienelactone hydrolase
LSQGILKARIAYFGHWQIVPSASLFLWRTVLPRKILNPAGNDDAWAALTWVADHVSEIGADPQRLAVGGDSAGGLLAAWVAQKAAKNGPRLRLQVLLYPNLDATTSRPSWKKLGTGAYLVSHAQMIEWYDAYLPQEINRKAPEVSPLFATDLSGVAPAFIITADHDPLHDEGDEYAAKLKAANVAVDHTCWPGMVHGLASLAGVLDAGKVLIDQTGAALRKAFKPSNVPLDIPGLIDTLAPNGRLHVVGAILEPMQVPAFGLILGQRSISGSPTGSPTAISTMLEFSARHSVAPITETFSMSKVNDALEHLRSGKARYRIVLVNDHAQSA